MFDDLRALENRQLVIVRNPFDRSEREVRAVPADSQSTVAALVGEYIPAGVDVSVSINGNVLAREAWSTYDLAPGDEMVVVPVVGKGNSLLGAVLMIALMVVAPMAGGLVADAMWGAGAASSLVGIGTLTWGTVIGMGIGLVGSMVIGALTAPTAPTSGSGSSVSPTYSWTPMTTQIPGAPISRAYGLMKLYGNIIAGYIEDSDDTVSQQTAHMLIELGMGPYDSLSDFKINDQTVSLYSNVKITERLGLLNQAVIPAFNDTREASTFSPAKVVLGTPIVRSTVGNQFSSLEVVITAPNGLWNANNQGGLDSFTTNLTIEVSRNGGAYKTAAGSSVTTAASSSSYWSAGYWVDGLGTQTWFETAIGSSNLYDHNEGDPGTLDGTVNTVYWRWITTSVPKATVATSTVTLSGNSQNAMHRTFRIDGFTPGDSCNVRVTNLTTDYSSNPRIGCAVYLAAITEVLDNDKFTYPRSVLVGVDALATNQLSGSMRFSCLAKGAKIWVGGPSGVFQWSQNPAWVCYDILTQPVTNDAGTAVLRYDGLNPSRLDLQSFTDWAAFCNVSVSDGASGMEPRCQFDGIYDTETDMWSAALDVAATARATLVMRGTTVAAIYDDARTTPSQVFTVANSSQFAETFLPIDGRASVIEIAFANEALDYGQDRISIVNAAVAAASGVATPASKTLRITRASQAWREANTMLARNQYLKRTGSLSVDIDSLAATVGDRIDIQADVPEWGEGGRAVSGTTTTVVLDHPITFATSAARDITVRLSNAASDAIQTRAIMMPGGGYPQTVSSITCAAFDYPVNQYDPWAIGVTGQSTKPFLITDIARDGDQRAKLTLIEYNASIYGIDGGIPALPTPNISASTGFGTIINVTATESQSVALDGTSTTVVTLHWGFSDRSQVRATRIVASPTGTSHWGQTDRMQRVTEDSAQFTGLEAGVSYLFTLMSENYLGQTQPLSAGATLTYAVIGKTGQTQAPGITGAPPAPTVLTAASGLFAVGLTWTVDVGGRLDIAYTEVWAGTTNNRASAARISCEPWPATTYQHIGLTPGQTWFYWVRLVDTSGNVSTWYPTGATSGVAGSPSTDPSALLAQLVNSLGMPQLAAELAAPIALIPGGLNAVSVASIQSALSDYDLTARMQFQEAVTNATITTDPGTGKIQLLATAAVTTDVEARLTAVEIVESADHATLTATVGSVATLNGALTTAQSQIVALQGSVSIGASETYVDNSIAGATGLLTVTAANTAAALAQAAIQEALDAFTQGTTLQAVQQNVAVGQETFTALAAANNALATWKEAVVAVVAGNGAAILNEQTARVNADSAEATARTTLEARVGITEGGIAANIASINTEATTRATAISAEAASRLALAAVVNDPTTGLAAKASSATLTSDYSTTAAMTSAISVANTTLQTLVAGNLATALTSYTTTSGLTSAISTAVGVVQARLDTGDFSTVKTESNASADAIAGMAAKWSVKVQTVTGGVRALAGIEVIAGGTDNESAVAFLADKLLVYKPDGTGSPRPVMILGDVNGTSTVGFDGNVVVDGTIITRTIAADNVTNPQSAYTSGSVVIPSTYPPHELQTVSVTTVGGKLNLQASATVIGGATSLIPQFSLIRANDGGPGSYVDAGGTTQNCSYLDADFTALHAAYEDATHVFLFSEQPSAGSYTYKLIGRQLSGIAGMTTEKRFLSVTEFKK